MKKMQWMALGLAIALVGGVALAGDGERRGRRAGRRPERRAMLRERVREALQRRGADRRAAATDFLASLQVTDDQRRLVLEKAKAAAPILADMRTQARTIVAQALVAATKDGQKVDRKAVRDGVRTQLQTLHQTTRTQIEALAKDVVASLTPDQRQKIEAAAQMRGRKVDDEKLTRFASRLISRPMTIAFLEARLNK